MRQTTLEVLTEEYRELGILPGAQDGAEAEKFKSLAELRAEIHRRARDDKRAIAALCFSGGGIRSATFNLGVLQGLAKHKFLGKFDYLSTVSGGGYIGSWLSAWIHRKGLAEVERQLGAAVENGDRIEPPEIKHLRTYSNYMSPRPGLFSADTWTLVAVYLRNLLLNWTYLVPLLMALLLVPAILLAVFKSQTAARIYPFVGWASLLLGVFALANVVRLRPYLINFFRVEKSRTAERWVLLRCVLPLVLSAAGASLFWLYAREWAARLPVHPIVYFMAHGLALFWGGYFGSIFLSGFFKSLITGKKETDAGDGGAARLDYRGFVFYEVLIAGFFTGALGGALLYLLATGFDSLVGAAGYYPAAIYYVCFGTPVYLLSFLLSATVFIGAASRFTDDMDREWMARFAGWLLILILGWAFLCAIVLFAPGIIEFGLDGLKETILGAVGGLTGLIALALGFTGLNSAKEAPKNESKSRFLLWFAPQVAAPIFVAFLIVLISYLTSKMIVASALALEPSAFFRWLRLESVDVQKSFSANFYHLPGRFLLLWSALLFGVSLLMGRLININKFSFHAIYRERLIRAYLGASRVKEREATANSFTGLDLADNVEMQKLRQRPLHVVNMTLNLAKTDNLRWQNRKAASFTATALHCGSSNMNEGTGDYRAAAEYGRNPQNGRAITLGTAAAVSGAAASPNMGYYTSSFAVSFLMALFNVRLGWWLGNPGAPGEETYNLAAPKMSLRPFIDEALGRTNKSNAYIYLSDGGHFDNLGLYEMVLRRAHLIVVADAACDGDFGFSDFGNAIHKIRVDMGIPIEFDRKNLPVKERNCSLGKIKYTAVDGPEAIDGVLIYIKPTLDGDEPVDIKNYAKENPDFPHQSTIDQFYSEAQFESYRTLGLHQIDSICCRKIECVCRDIEMNALDYLLKFQQKNTLGSGGHRGKEKNENGWTETGHRRKLRI